MCADVLGDRIARRPAAGPLFWRIVAALPLLAGANLWTTHHFGIGLENPGGLTATVTGVGGAVRLLDERRRRKRPCSGPCPPPRDGPAGGRLARGRCCGKVLCGA